MAQLRDKKTSEFLMEGTPEEIVKVAQIIGFDEVIFDDVGLAFDPDEVLASVASDIEAFQTVVDDPDAPDRSAEAASARIEELTAEVPTQDAENRLQEARDRLQG